jgi:hypothetical protein
MVYFTAISRDALGVEVSAFQEGLALALYWCNYPLIIETDCLELVLMLKNNSVDRFVYISPGEEIKVLLKVRQTYVTRVFRCQDNSNTFWLIMLEPKPCATLWLSSSPEGLMSICHTDCNLWYL